MPGGSQQRDVPGVRRGRVIFQPGEPIGGPRRLHRTFVRSVRTTKVTGAPVSYAAHDDTSRQT